MRKCAAVTSAPRTSYTRGTMLKHTQISCSFSCLSFFLFFTNVSKKTDPSLVILCRTCDLHQKFMNTNVPGNDMLKKKIQRWPKIRKSLSLSFRHRTKKKKTISPKRPKIMQTWIIALTCMHPLCWSPSFWEVFHVSNLTNCVSLTSLCPWSGLAHVRTADLPTPKNPQLSPFHPNPAGHAGRRLWGRKQLMVLMMVNFSFIATKLRGWAQFFSRRGDAVPAECLSDWDRSVLSNKNGSSVCGGSWF